jgi:hypothetical protein
MKDAVDRELGVIFHEPLLFPLTAVLLTLLHTFSIWIIPMSKCHHKHSKDTT